MSKKKLPNGIHTSEALNADDQLGALKDIRIPGGDTIRQTPDEKDSLIDEPMTEIRIEGETAATTASGMPVTNRGGTSAMGEPEIFVSIRRVDNITYELLESRKGKVSSVMRDTFAIVFTRAQYMLQSLAEGRNV